LSERARSPSLQRCHLLVIPTTSPGPAEHGHLQLAIQADLFRRHVTAELLPLRSRLHVYNAVLPCPHQGKMPAASRQHREQFSAASAALYEPEYRTASTTARGLCKCTKQRLSGPGATRPQSATASHQLRSTLPCRSHRAQPHGTLHNSEPISLLSNVMEDAGMSNYSAPPCPFPPTSFRSSLPPLHAPPGPTRALRGGGGGAVTPPAMCKGARISSRHKFHQVTAILINTTFIA